MKANTVLLMLVMSWFLADVPITRFFEVKPTQHLHQRAESDPRSSQGREGGGGLLTECPEYCSR